MPASDPTCLYAEHLQAYLEAVEEFIVEQHLEQARKVSAVRQWLMSLNIDPDLPAGLATK